MRRAMRQGTITKPSRLIASVQARPTSYDVAQLAGVSQSAVSRCFSPGASISPVTRKKVERAARSLGYSPNALARSLITRRSGLIGLVVTTATLRYSPQIVHDLSDALQKAGLMPLLTTLDDENALAAALPQILNYRPEAIVSLATVDATLIKEAAAHGVPIVLINRHAPRMPVSSIRCDHTGGMRQLVDGLIATGHRNFAFVAGPRGAPVSEERRLGFEQALKAIRITARATEFADYTYEGGHRAALTILNAERRIDAIVCANDAMALGALDACRVDLGLDVPGKISVTGFDDIPEACRPTRLLTTVRQPTEAMANLAVEEVLRLSRDPGSARHSHHVIEGTVLIRGSAR
jgi:DNA-binding LacI/PurR family transcriptional regulator